MARTRPTVWPMLAMALLISALTCLPVSRALAQDPRVLSLVEMALADCVGQALAIERALQEGPAATDGEAAQAAAARADALLQLAVTRYVGVGRIEAFRRRAARALEGTYLRMTTAMGVSGDPGGVISRTGQRFGAECGAYLD